MPFSVNCPACQKKLRLADAVSGKRIRCPQCQEIFKAENASEAIQSSAPPPLKREMPKAARKSSSAKVKAGSSSNQMLLVIGGAAACLFLLVLCAGGGTAWYLLSSSPTKTTAQVNVAAANGPNARPAAPPANPRLKPPEPGTAENKLDNADGLSPKLQTPGPQPNDVLVPTNPNPNPNPNPKTKQPGLKKQTDPPANQGKEPKEFTPKNGMYSITMPPNVKSSGRTQTVAIGPPMPGPAGPAMKGKTKVAAGPKQQKVAIETFEVWTADKTNFAAASLGVPANIMSQIPVELRFETFRDVFAKQLNGQLVDEKDLKQGNIAGKEYTIQKQAGLFRMQMYLVGGFVLYAIVDANVADAATNPQAEAFFASFRLSDKAMQ
jgi:hypothetical protein